MAYFPRPCFRCIICFICIYYNGSPFFYLFVARYAIGGLAGGEDKDSFWRVVAQCTAGLPENKPRYVMV